MHPKRATTIAHELIEATLSSGEVAIDATVGNGHDTLFLAQQVGDQGKVYGFDIQADAIASARKRLTEADLLHRVSLLHESHTEIRQHCVTPVAVVMFNLGYLPGGDLSQITQSSSTLPALEAALEVLRQGGILTCCCYPGHSGGLEEAEAVLSWAQSLDQAQFQAEAYNEKGRHEGRPFLVSVQRC